jgi:DNA-binding PadR family transcriptional regulator
VRSDTARHGSRVGSERYARHHHHPGPVHGRSARLFERGGIKFAILGMLKDKARHGYDIIREMEERSGGFYSPSPGAVYPTLQALEDQDLVTSTTEEGKKVYAITEAGIQYLEEHKERARGHQERWDSHWGAGMEGESREAVGRIRESLHEVRRAVRRCAGDSAKLGNIEAALQEAVTKIRDIAEE